MPEYANAILTKARAAYGRRISPAQYSELLRKQSVQEISAFLRERTAFSHALAGVQDSTIHRGQLESLLRRDMLYQYTRMAHYFPKHVRIYNHVVMEAEIDLLLSSLANILAHKANRDSDFVATLPAFLKPYACFDIYGLVECDTLEQLIELVEGAPYGPLFKEIAQRTHYELVLRNYAEYEYRLRKYYFDTLLESAHSKLGGKARQQMELIICTRAEMLNLNTIYRMKAYFEAPPGDIRRAMLPYQARIKPKLMEQLLDARTPREFMLLLGQKSPYKRLIDVDQDFIEGETDKVRYDVYRRLMRFSTSPEVVYSAFMLLREMEIENITRIIEGVRYQVPAERIEDLLYRL